MLYVGLALLAVGGIFAFVQGIRLLIVAFGESVAAGLMYIFVPFYALIFIITRWEKCKQPFLMGLGGVAVMIIGSVLSGSGMGSMFGK